MPAFSFASPVLSVLSIGALVVEDEDDDDSGALPMAWVMVITVVVGGVLRGLHFFGASFAFMTRFCSGVLLVLLVSSFIVVALVLVRVGVHGLALVLVLDCWALLHVVFWP